MRPFVLFSTVALLGALPATHAAAQAIPASATPAATLQPGLAVGTSAPDFSLPGATRYGLLRAPVTLSAYRGQTVVLAFFPKARTSGCTKQLEAYRDEYATLFRNGRGVTVIAISADPDTTLASWAHEADFPMVLVSDTAGVVGRAYGAYNAGAKMDSRYLYVIGPTGTITYTDIPFVVANPEAYTRLRDAVAAAR